MIIRLSHYIRYHLTSGVDSFLELIKYLFELQTVINEGYFQLCSTLNSHMQKVINLRPPAKTADVRKSGKP